MFAEILGKYVAGRGFVILIFLSVLLGSSGIVSASEDLAILQNAESDYRNHTISMSEFFDIIQTYNGSNDETVPEFGNRDKRDSPEQLTAVHTSDDYTPGENLTISSVITYPGELTAIGMRAIFPDGWVPVSVTAWGTTVDPLGNGGIYGFGTDKLWIAKFDPPNVLEMAWVSIPDSPIEFSYALEIPDEESADVREISAEVLYRRLGGEEQADITAPYPVLKVRRASDDTACSDSDSDGVPDQWDQCPDTPENSWTDKNGCPATEEQMAEMASAFLTLGDIDGDKKIGLPEAIHALQVMSGQVSPSTK